MTATITWDNVHALPIALLDSLHADECPYLDYHPCTCGVIPTPPKHTPCVEGRGIGFHPYPLSNWMTKVVEEILSGTKEPAPRLFHSPLTGEEAIVVVRRVLDMDMYMDILVHALIHLLRIKRFVTPHTLSKIVVVSAMVAYKYHAENDVSFGIIYSASLCAGVNRHVMKLWEIEYLKLIRHNLYVSPYEFYAFRRMYVDCE